MRFLFVIIALAIAAPAGAGTVTGSASFSGGYYTYTYMLSVSMSESGVTAFGLDDVADAVDVSLPPGPCHPEKSACGPRAGTVAPAGWVAVVDYALTNDAFFTTGASASPGSTVSGFVFYSTQSPGTVSYFTTDDLGTVQTGSTIGPAGP